MTTEKKEVVKQEPEKNLLQKMQVRINQLAENKEIVFPPNYSPSNALNSAWIKLIETKKDGKPITEHCTQGSIANALMKMVVQGLSPVKNQCYFIPYGDQLNFQRSYQGSIALAKRVGNVKEVNANLVYEGDTYETEINAFGVKTLLSHISPFENRDENKIKGAYCVVVFNDSETKLEDMTLIEIKRSWAQGATKGNSPAHQNFTGEMCKKTVINRALKTIINSSSDSDLFDDDENQPINKPISKPGENSEFVDFEEMKESPKEKMETEPTQSKKEGSKPELEFEKQKPGF